MQRHQIIILKIIHDERSKKKNKKKRVHKALKLIPVASRRKKGVSRQSVVVINVLFVPHLTGRKSCIDNLHKSVEKGDSEIKKLMKRPKLMGLKILNGYKKKF